MWNVSPVADAPPVIASPASRTCLRSMYAAEFPAIGAAALITTPSKERVKVLAVDVVFDTTIFVTIACLFAGTVYKAVLVVVVAAPLNSTLLVTDIIPP
jgi:hypothetical protein